MDSELIKISEQEIIDGLTLGLRTLNESLMELHYKGNQSLERMDKLDKLDRDNEYFIN